MGAFEDFVNANLGIRKPLISDFFPPTGVGKSTKAAGPRGSHFLDLSTNFIYEKTGENNNEDWVKIAVLGDSRGEPGGNDTNIQFRSGDKLAGTDHFIYNYDTNLASGVSGAFDNFFVTQDIDISGDSYVSGDSHVSGDFYGINAVLSENLKVSGDVTISGDLYVTGATHVTKVFDHTVSGTVSGYTGIFTDLIVGDGIDGLNVEVAIDTLSGNLITTGQLLSGNLDATGQDLAQSIDDITIRSEDKTVLFRSGIHSTGVEGLIYDYETSTLSGENIHGLSGYFANDLIVGEISNDAAVIIDDGNLSISDDLDVSGNAYVSGDSYFSGKLHGVTGYFSDDLIVGEISDDAAVIIDEGNLFISDNLDVSGDAYVSGDSHVSGDFYGTNAVLSENLNVSGDVTISGDLYVTGATHVTKVFDHTVSGTVSGYTGIFTDLIIGDGIDGLNLEVVIDTLSGNLITTGQLLSGNLDTTGQLLSGLHIDLSGHVDNFSGQSLATFSNLELEADILENDLLETGSLLFDKAYQLSGNLDNFSGQSLATFANLEYEISQSSDVADLILVSGESVANDIALSNDVSEINKKLPFLGEINVPLNTLSTGIEFVDIGDATNYITAPRVDVNLRSTTQPTYIYGYYVYDVSYTGFYIDFSSTITETNQILDIFVYNKD